jgi:hypothetical protein
MVSGDAPFSCPDGRHRDGETYNTIESIQNACK